MPKWLHPLLGGLVTWAIGIGVYAWSGRLGIFGLGYEDLSEALTHGLAWKLALVLLVGKLVATVASYAFGGCGGIFSPNLFFGAMCGLVVAGAGSGMMELTVSDQMLLAIGGMSACLGAVVQAPVTSILIIFEMTHQFSLLPGLMVAVLISQLIARVLNGTNFYEQALLDDGHEMEQLIPPRDLRGWQNLPISAVAQFKPVVVDGLEEEGIREVLEKYSYGCYPLLEQGRIRGVVSRWQLEAWLAGERGWEVQPPVVCLPGDSIRDVQSELIQCDHGLLILSDASGEKVLGVVTLHDLLRAQMSVSEREGS